MGGIEIEPRELGFRRPFTVEVAEILTIKNNDRTPVAFKVKTTAPRQYCVRPNAGRVEPGSEVQVQVLLQAMKTEPPPNTKCKDKFQVQTVAITADREFSNFSDLWQQLDGDKTAIQEKKIRVVFLPAEDHATLAVTPGRPTTRSSIASPDTTSGGQPAYSSPGEESDVADKTALLDQPPSPMAQKSAAPRAAIKSGKLSYEELELRLLDAEAMVASLRAGDGAGLKQRNTATNKGDKSVQQPQQPQQPQQIAVQQRQGGVPLNIAALLSLISFLLAYFFF